MSRQFWQETLTWATADGTAVANTTTETIIFPNVTVPANYMQDGRTLHIWAAGEYSTTSTPTLKFTLRAGGVAGTLLAQSAAITGGSAVSHAGWTVEIYVTTRTNGSSGTVFAEGVANCFSATAATVGSATGAPGTSFMCQGGVATPATATYDLTSDQAYSLTITWGTSSASNTLTGHNYYIEALN